MAVPEIDAYEQIVECEIDATRMVLEAPDRKMLVVAIAVDGIDVTLVRSVSSGTNRLHLEGFIAGVERELNRLKGFMAK